MGESQRYIIAMDDKKNRTPLTYADSGVDIDAGEQAVNRIKKLVSSTFNSQVLTGLGSFGGLFQPDLSEYKNPVLVSSTDSVGTKIKLAFMTNKHDTVGEDLVNHCVNDILVHGARGLFFLDYIGTGKVDPDNIEELVSGLSRGCQNAGLALIGGETAELTDLYQPGEYDLAGFVVGVVERSKIIDGSSIGEGDICLGLSSNGLHTNGYTLARKVMFEIARMRHDDFVDELSMTVAESLMKVHRCYAPLIFPLLNKFSIKGMAHITGGGIPGNLIRILPGNCQAEINRNSWPRLPLFDYLKEKGNIDPDDIYRSFNMGLGFILVVAPDQVADIESTLRNMSEPVYRIGIIKSGNKTVRLLD